MLKGCSKTHVVTAPHHVRKKQAVKGQWETQNNFVVYVTVSGHLWHFPSSNRTHSGNDRIPTTTTTINRILPHFTASFLAFLLFCFCCFCDTSSPCSPPVDGPSRCFPRPSTQFNDFNISISKQTELSFKTLFYENDRRFPNKSSFTGHLALLKIQIQITVHTKLQNPWKDWCACCFSKVGVTLVARITFLPLKGL